MRTAPSITLRRRAYADIRRQILEAELTPGSPLSEYQLSARLNISRTPVREALRELEREGLVVSIPQRGSFVAQITARDVLEIYQVREPLEKLAAQVAAERMPGETARALEHELLLAADHLTTTPQLALDADIHLHKALIAVLRNRRMEQILATLDDQVHIIRNLAPRATGRLEKMTAEHLGIARAVLAGRADQAGAAMATHLRSARDNALSLALPIDESFTRGT